MIKSVVTDASISFVARDQLWFLAKDHGNFDRVRDLLIHNTDDADLLIRLTDFQEAVSLESDGDVALDEDGLKIGGEILSQAWMDKALADPSCVRILTVKPGDRVRIEGDEDAPDGIYLVGDVDNADINKRVYVESDEDYFGYVANSSIKEILH